MKKKVTALPSSFNPEIRSLALKIRELILEVIPTKGLLEETGKLHRHVKLKTPAEVKSTALKALLKAALAAYKKRTASCS